MHWLQIWPPGGSRYIELNVNRPLANGVQFWDFVSHQKVSTSFTFFCLHCKFFSLSCIIYVYLQCRTESVPAFVEKSAEVRTGSFLFPATRSLANKKNSFSSILNSMLQAILTTTSSTEEERRKVEERTIGQFFHNINQPGGQCKSWPLDVWTIHPPIHPINLSTTVGRPWMYHGPTYQRFHRSNLDSIGTGIYNIGTDTNSTWTALALILMVLALVLTSWIGCRIGSLSKADFCKIYF